MLEGGIRRTPKRKPRREVRRPRPAPNVFGPPRAVTFKPTQRAAKRKVERAQRRLPERPLPAIPTLRRPTRRQSQAAITLAQRSVRGQDPGAVQEITQDPRARRRLAPVRQAQQRVADDVRVRTGLSELRSRPGAYGVSRGDLARLHRLAVAGKLPESARRALAGLGAASERAPIAAKETRGDRKTRLPLGAATVNVDALRRGVLNATSLGGLSPTRTLVRRSLSDIGILGTAPVLGGYQITRGTVEALRGDTSRLSALASGVAKGVAEEVTHPGKAFTEHPLLTALDAAAAFTVAGRAAGAVTRGLSGGARASTVRPPLALVDDAGTQTLVRRTKSKDVTRQLFQDAADARREPVRDIKGKPLTVKERGHVVPVLRATEAESTRHLQRLGNHLAGSANASERLAREIGQREGKVKGGVRGGVKGKLGRDLVAMVVEGTITTAPHFRQDLEAHAARLTREHTERTTGEPGYRHTAEEAAALNRIATVRTALNSPKVMSQAGKIVAAGIHHGTRLNKSDRELMAREILSEPSGQRSALIPAAIEHRGGRHFTVEAHRKLERAALKVEREAAHKAQTATGPAKAAAVAEFHAARAHRIAVSGRHPERVRAHEESRARVAKAETQVKAARSEQLQADRALSRLGGAQAVQRGATAAARMEAAGRGGRRSQNVLRYIDEALSDEKRLSRGAGKERLMERRRAEAVKRVERAKDVRRKAEKALRSERHRLRENPMPDIQAAVRTAEGKHLSNRDVENFLRSRGRDPESVAYLPHVLPRDAEKFARGAHHQQFRAGSRPDLDSGPTRTGEAYRKGATEASAELLRNQGVRQQTLLAKARHLDQLVSHGLRHPAWGKAQRGEQLTRQEQRIVDRGGMFTGHEAVELADRIEVDTATGHTVLYAKGGQQLVPVRAHGGRLDKETQRIIRENMQGPAAMETLPQRLLNDRILTEDELGKSRARNVVLVPKDLIDRLNEHLRPAGPLERFLQMLNRPFRLAVLPQPRWLTGNFIEPYFVRLPGIGSGAINIPGLALDIAAATKAVRRLERSGDPRLKALAHDIRAQHFGGLFLGGRGASNRRTRDEFATYRRVVAKLPAIEQMADLGSKMLKVGLWPLDQYFRVNRIAIEAPAQRAAFGRQLRRDIQEFSGSWMETVRLGNEAVDEAARGLLDTPTQRRFMAMQHELLGQYEGYGPRTRAIIQGPAPFLPWALSAARFVYWTMPMHRTAQTALLIKTQDVVSKAWEDEHKDAPPGGLRLAARTDQGGFVDFARYTPYGLTGPVVEGDPQGVTDQFLPQLTGAVAAMGGTDPFGRQLRVAPTKDNPQGKPSGGQLAGIAGYGLLESLTPYLSTIRRLQEHGETAYGGSTVFAPKTKPGTSHGMSALRRTFDPFRPTYLSSKGSKVTVVKGGRGGNTVLDRINEHRGADVQTVPDDVGAILDEINKHR